MNMKSFFRWGLKDSNIENYLKDSNIESYQCYFWMAQK